MKGIRDKNGRLRSSFTAEMIDVLLAHLRAGAFQRSSYSLEMFEAMLTGLREGKTCSQIGKEIGRSKNSVIGKMRRMREYVWPDANHIVGPGYARVIKPMKLTNHHPLVHWMDEEIRAQNAADNHMTIAEVSRRSGVSDTLIKGWRSGVIPGISNFDAVLGVLGYRLAVTEAEDK